MENRRILEIREENGKMVLEIDEDTSKYEVLGVLDSITERIREECEDGWKGE